jgi:transposase
VGSCQTTDIPLAKWGGHKRKIVLHDVLNGILYVLSIAGQWHALPKNVPAHSTERGYLQRWDYHGTLTNIHDVLFVACREHAEREASPAACVIDSQGVKSTEKEGGVVRSAEIRRGQEN